MFLGRPDISGRESGAGSIMCGKRRLIPFAEAKLPQSETGILAGNRLEATFDDTFLSETAEDVLEELTLN